MSDPMCSERVPNDGRSVGFHNCSRKAKVWNDGAGYCTQHDPERVKARRAESARQWRAKMDAGAASSRARSLTRCSEAQLRAECARRGFDMVAR